MPNIPPDRNVFERKPEAVFDKIRTARAEALTEGAVESVGLYNGDNSKPA